MASFYSVIKRFLPRHLVLYLLVLLCGAMTPFAFAPYRLFWLMPFLFAFLVFMVMRHEKQAVWLAFLWGFSSSLTQNYWVNISLHDVAGMLQIYSIPMTVVFALYLAIYPAVCFWILEKIPFNRLFRFGFALPIIWVLCEYLRSILLTGFSWGLLGYSQIADSVLAGFTPVAGIYAVSLAVAWIGAWIAIFFTYEKILIKILAMWCVALTISFAAHYASQQYTFPDGTEAKVALIQGNVEQRMKFDPQQISDDIQMYYEQVAKVQNADIIILPESAIAVLRQTLHVGVIGQFASTAKRNGADLAMGIIQYTPDEKGYENAIINLGSFNPNDPDNIPYYSKNHLVPFGEFRPLPKITAPLYLMMNMPLSDFSQGGVYQKNLVLANQRVAFNICYEDSFGDELFQAAKTSSLMANVSNMAWFGESNAMNLQLQHSQARALENGRYMVRATNNGITAAINPNGQITAMIPRDIRQTLITTVYGYTGETPFSAHGGSKYLINRLLWLLLVPIALVLLIGKYKTHKYKSKHSIPFDRLEHQFSQLRNQELPEQEVKEDNPKKTKPKKNKNKLLVIK